MDVGNTRRLGRAVLMHNGVRKSVPLEIHGLHQNAHSRAAVRLNGACDGWLPEPTSLIQGRAGQLCNSGARRSSLLRLCKCVHPLNGSLESRGLRRPLRKPRLKSTKDRNSNAMSALRSVRGSSGFAGSVYSNVASTGVVQSSVHSCSASSALRRPWDSIPHYKWTDSVVLWAARRTQRAQRLNASACLALPSDISEHVVLHALLHRHRLPVLILHARITSIT